MKKKLFSICEVIIHDMNIEYNKRVQLIPNQKYHVLKFIVSDTNWMSREICVYSIDGTCSYNQIGLAMKYAIITWFIGNILFHFWNNHQNSSVRSRIVFQTTKSLKWEYLHFKGKWLQRDQTSEYSISVVLST